MRYGCHHTVCRYHGGRKNSAATKQLPDDYPFRIKTVRTLISPWPLHLERKVVLFPATKVSNVRLNGIRKFPSSMVIQTDR